mmetsp:Transcript_34647/g.60928  ORF Transcript_34647/g.60928 Transcript_34647/m.60928 type:complete len:278 (-) Transcript_34647:567-1400(-)
MGIESSVMRDSNGNPIEDLYELANGCICCSVKDSFVSTVERIIEQRKDITRIVVEATGLADPIPIVSKFWLDDELESELQLDGVVVLVDLKHFISLLGSEHYELYLRQVSIGDCIVLNKADLVDAECIESVKSQVFKLNPSARVLIAERSQVDISRMYGTGSLKRIEIPEAPVENHLHGIDVLLLKGYGAIPKRDLEELLADVLWSPDTYGKIIRGKGVFSVCDRGVVQMFQSVGETFELTDTEVALPAEHLNRLMLTGFSLNEALLRSAIKMAISE